MEKEYWQIWLLKQFIKITGNFVGGIFYVKRHNYVKQIYYNYIKLYRTFDSFRAGYCSSKINCCIYLHKIFLKIKLCVIFVAGNNFWCSKCFAQRRVVFSADLWQGIYIFYHYLLMNKMFVFIFCRLALTLLINAKIGLVSITSRRQNIVGKTMRKIDFAKS